MSVITISAIKADTGAYMGHCAWDTFVELTEVAKRLHLYGAGQDLLAEAFSGNVRGAGPGVAEMEIFERASEPFIVFAADKTSPGGWNLPLYKMFCDPFNTAGLIIDNHAPCRRPDAMSAGSQSKNRPRHRCSDGAPGVRVVSVSPLLRGIG